MGSSWVYIEADDFLALRDDVGGHVDLRREHRGRRVHVQRHPALILFFTLVAGPRRSLSLTLSDTNVYEPQTRVRLGTTAHFCKEVVPWLRAGWYGGRQRGTP